MEAQQILVTSPLRGLNVNSDRVTQAIEYSADCFDVLPYDRAFRQRVTMRPGYGKITSGFTALGSGTGSCFTQGPNTLYYVSGAVCAGYGKGKVYYVNAGTVKEDSGSLAATTATPVPTTYAIATIWRNRLVLAGSDHQWIMSKVNDYGNFDVADTTVARAIAGTNAIYSTPGAVMDKIISLIPWNDDVLIIACDHTMWAIKGDPAYGGSINLLNNGVGILAGNAWTIDPEGALWMVGTGGVYRFMGGAFELASDQSYSAYFQAITRSSTAVTCAWDRDKHGLWIFRPSSGGLFYDHRKQGFWPIGINGNAAFVFDGTAPTDRAIYIGDQGNGVVYKLADANTADNPTGVSPTPIPSYVKIGPLMPNGPHDQAKIIQLDIVQGEQTGFASTYEVLDYTLTCGPSPYSAQSQPTQTATGTITATNTNKRTILGIRMQDTCFFLKLSASAAYDPGGGSIYPFFSFESANFHVLPGARGRN